MVADSDLKEAEALCHRALFVEVGLIIRKLLIAVLEGRDARLTCDLIASLFG
jgi:hypothetical protein